MGVTIHYRGTIQDRSLIETFEDRIVELALEFDGYARIWRTSSKTKPERVVRGVLLNLAPGHETGSFLVAPEGWLVPMHAAEEAEEGRMAERPWIACKTQYGPIEAHVMFVALLEALKREFIPDLEVRDEGGYWGTRDLEALRRRRGTVEVAADAFARELRATRISPEVREDPALFARQIERLAGRVKRTLERPPEHAPVRFADADNPAVDDDRLGTEDEWDALYKQNERRDARLMRTLDEKSLHGDLKEGDFEQALQDEGIGGIPGLDDEEDEDQDPDGDDGGVSWKDALPGGPDDDADAPWRESLAGVKEEAAREKDRPSRERHPLLQRATNVMLKAMKLPERSQGAAAYALDPLIRGMMEMSGGLSQVLASGEDEGEESGEDDGPYGYTLVQLKRSLRGIAHARGALGPAREAGILNDDFARHVTEELRDIEKEVQEYVRKTRERM
jgi:hypothetical protein